MKPRTLVLTARMTLGNKGPTLVLTLHGGVTLSLPITSLVGSEFSDAWRRAIDADSDDIFDVRVEPPDIVEWPALGSRISVRRTLWHCFEHWGLPTAKSNDAREGRALTTEEACRAARALFDQGYERAALMASAMLVLGTRSKDLPLRLNPDDRAALSRNGVRCHDFRLAAIRHRYEMANGSRPGYDPKP